MTARIARRVVFAALLFSVIAGFAVDYAASVDQQSTYPTPQELAESYEQYHGDQIVVWIRVTSISDGQFAGSTWTVETATVPNAVDVGDSVQIAGTARSNHVIDADRIVVTETWNRRYMFGVSALALFGAVLFVGTRWRISWERLALVPRDGSTPTVEERDD